MVKRTVPDAKRAKHDTATAGTVPSPNASYDLMIEAATNTIVSCPVFHGILTADALKIGEPGTIGVLSIKIVNEY